MAAEIESFLDFAASLSAISLPKSPVFSVPLLLQAVNKQCVMSSSRSFFVIIR